MALRKGLFWLVLVIVFGLVFSAGCVRWQEKTMVISVRTVDPFWPWGPTLPVAGAQVVIVGQVSFAIFTDFQGRAVTQVPPGSYRITVSRAGFFPATKMITIYTIELGPAHYDFQLVPALG